MQTHSDLELGQMAVSDLEDLDTLCRDFAIITTRPWDDDEASFDDDEDDLYDWEDGPVDVNNLDVSALPRGFAEGTGF